MNILNKRNAFSGHFDVTTYEIEEEGNKYQRDICESKDAVFVLPYDPVNKQVVLINEKRFGLLKHTGNIETWSSIAGTVDKELSLEDIVGLELMEEAGIDINEGELQKVCSHYSSPGIMSEKKHIYFFKFDSAKFKSGQYGAENENETTHAELFGYDEVFSMIEREEIMDLNVMFSISKIMLLELADPIM